MTPLALREALLRALLFGGEGPKPGAALFAHGPDEAAVILPGSREFVVLRQFQEGDEAAPLLARIEALRLANPRASLSLLVLGGGAALRRVLRRAAPIFRLRDPLTLFHAGEEGRLWCSRTFGRTRRLVGPVLERALHEARAQDPPARTLAPEEREFLLSAQASVSHSEESAFWRSLEVQPTTAIWTLTAAMVGLFALETLWGGSEFAPTLYRMGANVPDRALSGEPWRLFSAAFLHIGVLHIVLNLWALRVFGMFLEKLLGAARFLALYGLSALGGSLASVVSARSPLSAGASGALWGLMVAGLALAHRPRGLLPDSLAQRMRSQGWPVLIANALFSFTPRIDLFAHFGGGLVGGLLLATGSLAPGPPRRRAGPAVLALAGAVSLAMAASVATAIVEGRPWEIVRPPSAWVRVSVPGTRLSLEAPGSFSVRAEGESPGPATLRIGDDLRDPLVVFVESEEGYEGPAPTALVEELRSALDGPDTATARRSVRSVVLGGHPTAVAEQNLPGGRGARLVWLTARGRAHVTIMVRERPETPPAWRAAEPRFVETLR